ncbi:hypothetical protein EJ05DRAFT_475836 [Pseudovirgaria hyperparasitica]|uniref:Plus3 domain-containing protein n=1 Tax=Pseudovirgaria hyperparasitica TaxID=470096 RepID=A0A6A6W7C3_9PEZI|nr:uncharacterized protein EJ05DRAFT_475836 [Pseudovirgaria hyperparasitica]KAF2758533.1 hypothetical protein EJ05DRAFT_475836 [Pseudovirgaria hyperparasitica]
MSDNGDLDAELLALADEEEEEEEEEAESGEASAPGSPDSLGSGAMSESDDEGAIVEDGGSLYPLEGKYRDASDKAKILGLSEIQREQILADRAAEIEKQTQDKYLEQLFQQRDKKRNAEAAELDEIQRKTSRPKVKAHDPLESYKRSREQRGQELQRQRERKERRGRASRSPSSARPESEKDADGDSDEVEYAENRRVPPKEDPPADIKDVMHALIKRENFAKVCFWPDFEKALLDCFCRVSVGPGEHGANTYRIGQITGFETKQPYVVENDKGKKIMTDLYVTCKHGRDVKTVPFSHVSNSRATENEFDRYKAVVAAEGKKFPTRSVVHGKLEDITNLLNRRFTDQELSEKLKRQDKYAARLMELTASALPARQSQSQMQADRLANLNAENRRKNNEEIRNALLEERRVERKRRQAAQRKYEERQKLERAQAEKETTKARLAVPTDDLFDGSDISRTATPGGNELSRAGTPLQKKERNAIPTFKKKAMDDDVIAAMDFGLEVDI